MIQLTRVIKKFGQRLAVNELSLTVPRGEIFGLLGHNGAGKSTAIGMMLGQVWPSAGEVMICGHDVTSHRACALQKVGAIFETPAFYDYLTGWRNLEILSHYSAATPAARIKEVVDWVGLTGREHGKVRTYSHGMRARLALAQALLPNPELLILDEPGEGLDPEGIHEMRQTILRLHRELNLTILLSSHLLSEVEQTCTRIAVLNQGRKVFEVSMNETKRRNHWVRLQVGDFAAAVQTLTQANLISDSRDGAFIALRDGAGTDQVVQRLVEQGIAVFEIAREAETLESFYLSLMSESKKGARAGARLIMLYLQLRNELWKLFGKKRTYIGFGAILLAQAVIVLVFRYSNASRGMMRQLESNGYPAEQFISSLTIATVMLFPIAYVLLPLYTSLVGGDLVAKEAEDGTLRMILSRPITRFRLLFIKWLAGAIFSALLTFMLGVLGILFATALFSRGGLFVFVPGEVFGIFDWNEGLARYAAAHLVLAVKATTVTGLAFMFSCFNVKPAAATILALSFVFVNFVLMQIPFFRDLQHWFLTYHLNVWQSVFAQPVPWWRIGESLSVLAGFNLTFMVIGCTAFQMRDIKS